MLSNKYVPQKLCNFQGKRNPLKNIKHECISHFIPLLPPRGGCDIRLNEFLLQELGKEIQLDRKIYTPGI